MLQANRKVERVAHPAAATYAKSQAKQHTTNRKVNLAKHVLILLKTDNTHPTIESHTENHFKHASSIARITLASTPVSMAVDDDLDRYMLSY